jgi:hypothetical protein
MELMNCAMTPRTRRPVYRSFATRFYESARSTIDANKYQWIETVAKGKLVGPPGLEHFPST